MTEPVGLDGLSASLLRATRASFWDEAFTAALIAALPRTTRILLDVGCGLGQTARALLPLRPGILYLGVDADAGRAIQARKEIEPPMKERVRLLAGRAEALPVGTTSVDAALTVMALQHVADAPAALREARRVVRPGGRVIAAEPDNLGQLFYIDGPLPALTQAIAALASRVRDARAPADVAIGPRLALLMAQAGLEPISAAVHAVHGTRMEAPAAFLDRMHGLVRVLARLASLPEESAEVRACDEVLADIRRRTVREKVLTAHVVPVFIVAAARPA